jgi:hypothetical protein
LLSIFEGVVHTPSTLVATRPNGQNALHATRWQLGSLISSWCVVSPCMCGCAWSPAVRACPSWCRRPSTTAGPGPFLPLGPSTCPLLPLPDGPSAWRYCALRGALHAGVGTGLHYARPCEWVVVPRANGAKRTTKSAWPRTHVRLQNVQVIEQPTGRLELDVCRARRNGQRPRGRHFFRRTPPYIY